MIFNPLKLTRELLGANLQITGCRSDGVIFWIGQATQAQLDQAAAILAAHDPTPAPDPLDALRAKRKLGQALNAQEIQAVLDKILGL